MAFLETDQQFLATHPASSTDGTTASVAVIQPIINGESDYNSTSITNLLTIGHIGDSRIVLCDSVDGKARQLSVDHSPTLAEERKRIESAGGWISQDSFGQHAVMGMLATSRSIGVAKLKAMGRMIISEPQILSHPIDSRDSFIILMTDGTIR
jgi:protein phosphatase PTC6